MLSTVLAISGALAVVAGASYLIYMYYPVICDFWNQLYTTSLEFQTVLPDWLWWLLPVALALAGLGLVVKLL